MQAEAAKAAALAQAASAPAATTNNTSDSVTAPTTSLQPPAISPDGVDHNDVAANDDRSGVVGSGTYGVENVDIASLPPWASHSAASPVSSEAAAGPDDGQLLPLEVMGSSPETFPTDARVGYAGCVIIKAPDLYRLIDDDNGDGTGVLVIDVRPTTEFKASHIEPFKEVRVFV